LSTVVGNEAKDDPSKTSRLLMGPEQVTRPKTLQAVWSWRWRRRRRWWWWWCYIAL